MMNRAIIVNGDFIVSEKHESIYEGDIVVECNAIMKTFMTSRMQDVEGGTLYANGCPSLNEAAMIISARLTKVVFSREPVMSDELCAIELLKENGIEVICNPEIILE